MVGKFLLGMVSGGLLVTGGLVVGSILFPVHPANDNRAVAAVEEPIEAPAATKADAGAAVAKPEDAASEADAAAASEPTPAPEPEATEEPVAAALEPAVEPTPEPEMAEAVEPAVEAEPVVEPAQPEVADTLPAPEAPKPETAAAEAVAPEAGKVTAPETAAEPSKPADTTADVAAAPPEPAPDPQPAADPTTAEATTEPAPDVAVTEPAPTDTAPTDTASTDTATTDVASAEPAPAAPTETATTEAEPATVETADIAPAQTETATPVTEPATEAPAENAPVETEVAESAPEPAPPPQPAPAVDLAPAAAPAEAMPAETMPAAPEIEVAEAAPEIVAPEMPGTKPEALPEVAAEQIIPDTPLTEESDSSTFKPAPGLPRAGEGVIIGRGTEAETAPADAGAIPADSRPIAAFATPFENPDAKPAFAIVLIDDGRADLDRAGLAALPIPATIALDPLDLASPERAAAYRAAGKEVVMLVTGIAEGAQASDVEVAFQSMAQGLPEAVAAMDLATPAFQNNRGLSSAVVPILKAQGRGLLPWDEGLNAADQVARREDLEAATVFRDIGTAGSDRVAVRRLLDRAVFKAGQEGRVAVVGTADAETLAALLEWTVEGKAATVALAPVTAVLKID